MEFAMLDNLVKDLEKEKEEYVQSVEARLAEIRKCIDKMKEEYRKETLPEVNGMVEYLLERAKKRFGDKCIEVSDIPEDIIDSFYDWTDRKFDIKRIVLGYQCDESNWLLFTDSEVCEFYDSCIGTYGNIIPYKSIIDIKLYKGGLNKVIESKFEGKNRMGVTLENAIHHNEGENIIRLLLDLRDYVKRS